MKIVILAQPRDAMPADGSSVGLWIGQVARCLRAEHEVHVISRRVAGRPGRETVDGVVHHRVSTRPDELVARAFRAAERGVSALTGHRPDWFYRGYYFGPLYFSSFALRAARLTRALDADAVLVSNFSQFLRWFARMGVGCRVLVMHCDWLAELPLGAVRRRLRRADRITGCSDYIVNNVCKRLPEVAARCHTVHNGSRVPAETPGDAAARRRALGIGKDTPLLLFVGRVTPEKGVHVLLQAMGGVLEQFPEATLLIAGALAPNPPSARTRPSAREAEWEAQKPGYRAELERLAAPFASRVRLLGSVSHAEVLDLYRACDVFVHPALWNEPFGMILTEAMACAKPVVATRTGGIPEIVVDGETGLLVNPDCPDALAAACCELLGDPERRTKFGAEGQRRAATYFTWERTARALVDAIESD